jgi:cation:H+ antiporter
MALDVLICLVGFGLLYFGAEWLVKGSASLARDLGISPIVIGLTVVAFGTSAPELVISLISSLGDLPMIAVTNAVGSNICNIALVLGLAAALRPITCDRAVVRRDIPVMLVISLVTAGFLANGMLGRIEGAVLFLGILLYVAYNIRITRKERARATEKQAEAATAVRSRAWQILLVLFGIAGVVLGAKLVVDSAVAIMHALGVSQRLVGLTLVALSTSLPELATSVVAALRREMDISVGNLVGSNVFNLLCVLGVVSTIRPIPIEGGFVESGLVVDCAIMIGISALPWWMMRKNTTVGRLDGFVLLACYGGFLALLLLTGRT